jgi:hypothetical protein
MHTTQGAREPGIYLRSGVGGRLREILGCQNDSAIARTIGIDQSQYSRVANSGFRPGLKFISNLLNVTRGKACFEDLFEVVDEDATESLRQVS